MERKIDVLLQTVINGQRRCEDNATKKVYETVTVSSINRFAAKMSKDAKQTNSNIGKSTNFFVNNTTPDELKQNLEGKREKPSNWYSRSKLPSERPLKEQSDSKLKDKLLKGLQQSNSISDTSTSTLLQKMSTLQNSVDEIHKTMYSSTFKPLPLTTSMENTDNYIKGAKITTKQTGSIGSISTKMTNKIHPSKKYRKLFSDTSSSSSSEDSDDKGRDDLRNATDISFSDQLSEICSDVQLVKEKMNTWLRYSKKAIKSSDDNTKLMLEKILNLEMALHKSTTEGKMVHDDILKKFDDVKNNSVAMQSLNSKGAEDFEEKVSKKLQNHYVLLRNTVVSGTYCFSCAILIVLETYIIVIESIDFVFTNIDSFGKHDCYLNILNQY